MGIKPGGVFADNSIRARLLLWKPSGSGLPDSGESGPSRESGCKRQRRRKRESKRRTAGQAADSVIKMLKKEPESHMRISDYNFLNPFAARRLARAGQAGGQPARAWPAGRGLLALAFAAAFLGFAPAAGAYHSLCFSPLELASLLSQGRSGGGGKSAAKSIRKKLRNLRKKMDKLDDAADDLEEALQESLDSQKTGPGNAGKAARDIRNYIKNKKSEWGCAELSRLPGQTGFPALSLLSYPLFLQLLGGALIPEAEAAKNPGRTVVVTKRPAEDDDDDLYTAGRELAASTSSAANSPVGAGSASNSANSLDRGDSDKEDCAQYTDLGLIISRIKHDSDGECLCSQGRSSFLCKNIKEKCQEKLLTEQGPGREEGKKCVKERDPWCGKIHSRRLLCSQIEAGIRHCFANNVYKVNNGEVCLLRGKGSEKCRTYEKYKKLPACKECEKKINRYAQNKKCIMESASSQCKEYLEDKYKMPTCSGVVETNQTCDQALHLSKKCFKTAKPAKCSDEKYKKPLCKDYCGKYLMNRQAQCIKASFNKDGIDKFCADYFKGFAECKTLGGNCARFVESKHDVECFNGDKASDYCKGKNTVTLCAEVERCQEFKDSSKTPHCILRQQAHSACTSALGLTLCPETEELPVEAAVSPVQVGEEAAAGAEGGDTAENNCDAPRVTDSGDKKKIYVTTSCVGVDKSRVTNTSTIEVGRDYININIDNSVGKTTTIRKGDDFGDKISGMTCPEGVSSEVCALIKSKLKQEFDKNPQLRCAHQGGAYDGARCCAANRPWQNEDYAGGRGKINEKAFCEAFAADDGDCRKAIKRLEQLYLSRMKEFERAEEELENELHEAAMAEYDDDEGSEGEADCEYCDRIQAIKQLYEPSTSQKIASFAGILGGAALSYFGLREARKASISANDMRAWQGLPAENNFMYNLAGIQAGVPFMRQGIYGLTNGYHRQGAFGCSQTANHYPRGPVMYRTPYW